MKWSDDYATGVQFVDEQHKMIFKWAEDLRAALEEGLRGEAYSELLNDLSFYTQNHFRFEEHCMNEYRCPVAKRNKNAHVSFIEVMSGFRQRYDASGYDHNDAQKLADFVDEWLTDHICRIDIHLKRCVNK